MKSSTRNKARIVVMIFLVLALAGAAWGAGFQGGVPWQIGDIVVCFGNGTCNVLRISGNTVTLLDQFSDGLSGDTRSVAISNTLHAVVTDNAGGGQSKVVVYSIASLNPLTVPATTVAHTPVNIFSANGGANANNAQAVVMDGTGHIFVGNSGSGGTPKPSIVELNPDGTLTSPSALSSNPLILPSNCTDNKASLLSMDLSSDGSSMYITSNGGTIQKLTMAAGTCAPFANFGPSVTLGDIKDIPPGALAGVSPNCNGATCPSDEAILVVAKGFTDPDNDEGNVCYTTSGQPLVSCALLLDTSSSDAGLTTPLWQANFLYSSLYPNTGSSILDPLLHLQGVYTEGTSGGDEPNFSETGGTVIDNAAIWTEKGRPAWNASTSFAYAPFPGTYIVDSNLNLQTVALNGNGISGPNQPSVAGNNPWNTSGGTTVDGLSWTDQGQSVWMANSSYFTTGTFISDPSTHAQKVVQAGTSAPSGTQPVSGWNDVGGRTIEGVTWLESHPTWSPSSLYASGAMVMDSHNHVQQVFQPGTSGSGSAPNFTQGGQTDDNTVTWFDIGQAIWRPSFSFGLNAIIVDGNGHVQEVTTTGTSGPGPQPTFSSSPTTDGLQWQNSGSVCGGSCNSPWAPGTPYTVGASIDDGSGFVWNAITSGTSGATSPAFTSNETPNFVLADNAVIWTDQGLLSGSTVFNWQPSHAYSVNAEIVDASNHVELVTIAGTSGPGPSAPAFVDGGTVSDGSGNPVVWGDIGLAVWRPGFSYGLNAIIVDGNGNVQQVTTAGTTGSSQPSFSSSPTTDGTVVWTNQGALAGSIFTWQAGFQYSLNEMIVDSNNHVELATTAGQSGGGPNPPAFVDGGSVVDGLIWADQGQPAWVADHNYSVAGIFIVDTNNNLETVSIPGISGPSNPSWQVSGTTIDGLIWADQGAWKANTQYFALGTAVGDAAGHVHFVFTTGTSGSGALPAGGWVDNGGTTIDNAVRWTESHPVWALNHHYMVGNADTLILDSNNNVQLVTTTGISGPSQPSAGGHNPWSATTGGNTIDGLQWKSQTAPAPSVVARYPVTGVTTLQSMTLDPLVSDCTAVGSCTSQPTPRTSNFWLADTGSANFYKLDFATGTPLSFSANASCPGCAPVSGIQGLRIYGAEGSTQPNLAKLFTGQLNTADNFTATVNFPTWLSAPSINNWTITEYPYSSSTHLSPTPVTLYGSLVSNASSIANGGNNSGATDAGVQCEPTTTDPTKCIVWKADLYVPPVAYLSENLISPTGIDNGTDVFIDLHYDATVSVGIFDPMSKSSGSVHSVHEITTTYSGSGTNSSGCFFVSPAPAGGCFKSNRNTLPFVFQCTNLTPSQMAALANKPGPPVLSMVESFPNLNPKPAPQVVPLTTTNSKAPFRYDSGNNEYVFNWSPQRITGTFRACAFDPTNTVQSFCVDFKMKTSCP